MSGTDPVRDTAAMIAGMAPEIVPGHMVFAVTGEARLLAQAFAVIREEEGTTAILPAALAHAEGLGGAPMLRIRLMVHSALDGVGLTAAVAGALAAEGIPANVVAGFHHDHVFVPADRAEAALAALRRRAVTP